MVDSDGYGCVYSYFLQFRTVNAASAGIDSSKWLAMLWAHVDSCANQGGCGMTSQQVWVTLDVGQETTADELNQLSHELREELLELDSVEVSHATAPALAGSKGPADVDPGTLVVTLFNSAFLVALAGVLKSWVNRAARRKVTVRLDSGKEEIEISGASAEDITALVQSWIARHEQQR